MSENEALTQNHPVGVLDAMRKRASMRAFLDRGVSRETVAAILDAARWAPSGVNIQPWQVAAVAGEAKRRIGDAIIAAREADQRRQPDYPYYPEEGFEPDDGQRKECGLAMYSVLAIGREDTEKRTAAWDRNYRFFDAPVGLLCFLDRNLGQGAWIDMGMFIQNIMLAGRAFGLATYPQASPTEYPDIIRGLLGIEPNLAVVCGIALGYPDIHAPVNDCRTSREPVEAFTCWYERTQKP